MTELNEDEIRARFESLRSADEARAPSFRAVLEREAPRATPSFARRRYWRSPVVLSLAAAAAIIVAVSVVRRSAAQREFVAQPLSMWTSPTAGLLPASSSTLLTHPMLLPSVFDGVSSTRISRKGN